MKSLLALALLAPLVAAPAPLAKPAEITAGGYVAFQPGDGRFPVVAGGRAAPIVVSAADYAGVIRVVDDVQSDIQKVTGVQPAVGHDHIPAGADPIIVGTLGKSLGPPESRRA